MWIAKSEIYLHHYGAPDEVLIRLIDSHMRKIYENDDMEDDNGEDGDDE